LLLALVLQAAPPSRALASPARAVPPPQQATTERPAQGPEAPPSRPEIVKGEGRPAVPIPRIEASVNVDGRLDEEAWASAARLGGFWQQQPVDGRPAEEQTEILVWYSPEAIHFGIIASDSQPETIRATMADRDNLDRDDTVTIFLDTFFDRRRAFFFAVNPLGAQQDGVQTEGAGNAGHTFGFNQGDRNPDYQFDSKGMLTPTGYVVEVRIPFKSLRYPGNKEQTWGFNVQRKIQRTGYQDTWTDVRRASSSFLAQSGAISGLRDMKRGVVTEVQPFLAASVSGQRGVNGAFSHGETDYTPGVNARLGFTNTSIDATVNPDFSQVESDAGQVTVNERFALFYPEKRPFFLEGNELFATPNQLVYTRQIVQPIAGGKVTGKAGQTTFAYLAARDRADDGDATFNIARVRQDIGVNSMAGLTFTDRTTAIGFNRVVAADARITFAKMYYVQAQAGGSWTDEGSGTKSAPAWNLLLDCTGRAWGCRYELLGVGTDFVTRSGFVPRNDFVQLRASNRLSWYGGRGAAVEEFSLNYHGGRFWEYAGFGHESPVEGEDRLRVESKLRGGWEVQGTLGYAFVEFDPARYAGFEVLGPGNVPVPFVPADRSSGFAPALEVTSPVFRRFNASLEVSGGAAAIFPEASDGRERSIAASVSLRPTDSIRAEGTLAYSRLLRERDGSEFARTVIPRVKVEYQPRRSLFVRVVAEYRGERQSALVDGAGNPLLTHGLPIPGELSNGLRLDTLFSYEPTPGTVVFFGYGSSMDAHQGFRLRSLERRSDGFFLKLAYLFRR
jgi:hypothetical protein